MTGHCDCVMHRPESKMGADGGHSQRATQTAAHTGFGMEQVLSYRQSNRIRTLTVSKQQ